MVLLFHLRKLPGVQKQSSAWEGTTAPPLSGSHLRSTTYLSGDPPVSLVPFSALRGLKTDSSRAANRGSSVNPGSATHSLTV